MSRLWHLRGGRGAGLDELSFDENEATSQTPPPPRFAWSPSPAIAVADKRGHSSRCTCIRVFVTALKKPLTKRGKRSAERRTKCFPHRAFRCRHLKCWARTRASPLSSPDCAGRPEGGALASRRLAAALAKSVTPWLGSGPRFLELPGADGRTLPGASAASSSQTGQNAPADRFPSRPKAKCVAPPAGTAPAPPSGAPS